MDVLSDVLRRIGFQGGVFCTAEMTAPWSVALPPSADGLALIHIVKSGACWIIVGGHAPIRATAGNLIVLPQGHAHVLCSHTELAPTPMRGGALVHAPPSEDIPRLTLGGGGSACRLLSGYIRWDQHTNPLGGVLPHLLWARLRQCSLIARTEGSGQSTIAISAAISAWLAATVRYAAEASAPRSRNRANVARLIELLFVEVLRVYVACLPPAETGWLAGLDDPKVGPALQLLHGAPGTAWTVETLGAAAGVSRSVLARRFAELIGMSPMRYLARWRMQLAKQLLRDSQLSIGDVATRVGYASEAAFNRAFRRQVGQPPARWRTLGSAPSATVEQMLLVA